MVNAEYINIGLPRREWLILQLATGELRDLGFVTIQEQMVLIRPNTVQTSAGNRVLVHKNGENLLEYWWVERELDARGEFTGIVRTGDKTLFHGEAAYHVAKRIRKLLNF